MPKRIRDEEFASALMQQSQARMRQHVSKAAETTKQAKTAAFMAAGMPPQAAAAAAEQTTTGNVSQAPAIQAQQPSQHQQQGVLAQQPQEEEQSFWGGVGDRFKQAGADAVGSLQDSAQNFASVIDPFVTGAQKMFGAYKDPDSGEFSPAVVDPYATHSNVTPYQNPVTESLGMGATSPQGFYQSQTPALDALRAGMPPQVLGGQTLGNMYASRDDELRRRGLIR